MSVKEGNADAKCRTCNEKSTNLFLLQDHEPYTKRTFAELLCDIAKIDVKADNVHCNLPKHICGNCSLKLTSAYSFVKQAQQVNASLLAAVRNVQQRKQKPTVDEEEEYIPLSPEVKLETDMVDEEMLDECLTTAVYQVDSLKEEEEAVVTNAAVSDFDPITTRNDTNWSSTFEDGHIDESESLSSNAFEDITDVLALKDIFLAPMTCNIIDQRPEFQLELCDLQADLYLKYSNLTGLEFWKAARKETYPRLRNAMLKLYSMYDSTYLCEVLFSDLNLNK